MNAETPSDRVLPLADAAKLMNMHTSTVRRCAQRGEIKIVKLSIRRIGIRQSELKRWLDSREAA